MTDDPIKYVLAAIERIEVSQEIVRAELASLRIGQDSLRTGQDSLRTDLDSLRAELASLRTGQDSLRTDLANLRAGQDRLRVDLMERMDRLQHEIGLVRDDVTASIGSSDNALRIAKGASDEVRGLGEILSTMRRQISRLQTDVEALRGGGGGGAAV